MTLEERRAELVRKVWDFVVPEQKSGTYFFGMWIPEKISGSFGLEIGRKDLDRVDLGNPETCLLCFAKIHRSLSRNWRRLQPELATIVFRSIEDLDLWEGFDRNRIQLSDARRDVTKVRFDISDVIFAHKKSAFHKEIEALSVDVERMLIQTNADNQEQRVIEATLRHVELRAQVDLAVITVQSVQRRTEVIERIALRTRLEAEKQFVFLRDLFKNSMWWTTPDGKTYLGADEVPPGYSHEITRKVNDRLRGFEEGLEKFLVTLKDEIPPRELVDECAELLRSSTMPVQNNTTNIQISNSQVGLINTGTMKDVHSIDASITTLKSHGDIEVGDAFKRITEEVVKDSVLSETEKAELLSNVKYLSDAASKKEEPRNQSVIKSVLKSVSDGLSVAGPAVKALVPLIPLILKYFGL